MNTLTTTPIIDYLLNLTYMIIFMCICMLFLNWFKAKAKEKQEAIEAAKDVVRRNLTFVTPDQFPKGTEEFVNDAHMQEIEATCDLYIAAKDLVDNNYSYDSLSNNLRHALGRFESHVL